MAKKKGKKGKKILITVLCVFLALVIILFAVGFSYWNKIKKAEPIAEDTLTYDFDDETEPSVLADDPEFDQMFEQTASSFKQSIKDWAKNGGEIMYNDNVINVLCIGVDTRNKNTISGLTDSMMIVSVNRKLGTITLTSIMRDTYAYLESPDGTGSYNKINSAFPFYGADNLIDTIEAHFKIRIDGYAMINFAFFKAVIDKMDGVTVPVPQYVADYLNKNYTGLSVEAGDDVTLYGDEALAFCRSRKCDVDGDVSRTMRQRQVMNALLRKATTIKTSDIDDYLTAFMPYVKTSYSESEIVSLATKAVVGGWANFKVQEIVMPDEASRYGHSGSSWFWAVDFPLAAQTLQKTIYGDTNITLQDNRVTSIDLLLSGGEG